MSRIAGLVAPAGRLDRHAHRRVAIVADAEATIETAESWSGGQPTVRATDAESGARSTTSTGTSRQEHHD